MCVSISLKHRKIKQQQQQQQQHQQHQQTDICHNSGLEKIQRLNCDHIFQN